MKKKDVVKECLYVYMQFSFRFKFLIKIYVLNLKIERKKHLQVDFSPKSRFHCIEFWHSVKQRDYYIFKKSLFLNEICVPHPVIPPNLYILRKKFFQDFIKDITIRPIPRWKRYEPHVLYQSHSTSSKIRGFLLSV